MKFIVLAMALLVCFHAHAESENTEAQRVQCLKAYAAYASDWKAQDFERDQIEVVRENEDGTRTEYVWNGKRVVRTPVAKNFLFGHTDIAQPEAIWDQASFDQSGNGKLSVMISDSEIRVAQEEILRAIFQKRQLAHEKMTRHGRSNIYPSSLVRATYDFLEQCTGLKTVSLDGNHGTNIGDESVAIRQRLESVHSRRW